MVAVRIAATATGIAIIVQTRGNPWT